MGFFGDPIWEFLSQRLEIFSKFGDFYGEFFQIWGFLSPRFLTLGNGNFSKCGDFYPGDWGFLSPEIEDFRKSFLPNSGYIFEIPGIYILEKSLIKILKRFPITGMGIGNFHLGILDILIIIKLTIFEKLGIIWLIQVNLYPSKRDFRKTGDFYIFLLSK